MSNELKSKAQPALCVLMRNQICSTIFSRDHYDHFTASEKLLTHEKMRIEWKLVSATE